MSQARSGGGRDPSSLDPGSQAARTRCRNQQSSSMPAPQASSNPVVCLLLKHPLACPLARGCLSAFRTHLKVSGSTRASGGRSGAARMSVNIIATASLESKQRLRQRKRGGGGTGMVGGRDQTTRD